VCTPSSGLLLHRAEHSAGPAFAQERPHGCPAAWFLEGEAPDRRPTDAPQRATAEWDASVCARQDGAAAALLALLSPQTADGVGRWAGQARDAQEQDASRRRLEPQAAPAAEPVAQEPYRPALARFAERSCGAPEVAAQTTEEQSVKRLPIQPEVLPQVEPASGARLDALVEQTLALMQLATTELVTKLTEVRPPHVRE